MSAQFQWLVTFTWYEGQEFGGVVTPSFTAATRAVSTEDGARRVASTGREANIVPVNAEDLEVTIKKQRRTPPGPWHAAGPLEVVVLETNYALSPFAKKATDVASRESMEWWLERIKGQLADLPDDSPLKGFSPLRSRAVQEEIF